MPDLGPLASAAALALLTVVLVWFAVGTQTNIRRGNRILSWMQEGLPLLGPRATLKWFGSSVAALRIVEPVAPVREAEVLVVLEPRDLGAVWALLRSRGRRDFIVVRVNGMRAPRFRADLSDPRAWTARDRRADEEPPSVAATAIGSGGPYELRHDGDAPLEALGRAWEALAAASAGTWRLSVRPTVPHVEVHLLPPSLAPAPTRGRGGRGEPAVGSARLFSAVRELLRMATAEPGAQAGPARST
jgi:hypothetical protein